MEANPQAEVFKKFFADFGVNPEDIEKIGTDELPYAKVVETVRNGFYSRDVTEGSIEKNPLLEKIFKKYATKGEKATIQKFNDFFGNDETKVLYQETLEKYKDDPELGYKEYLKAAAELNKKEQARLKDLAQKTDAELKEELQTLRGKSASNQEELNKEIAKREQLLQKYKEEIVPSFEARIKQSENDAAMRFEFWKAYTAAELDFKKNDLKLSKMFDVYMESAKELCDVILDDSGKIKVLQKGKAATTLKNTAGNDMSLKDVFNMVADTLGDRAIRDDDYFSPNSRQRTTVGAVDDAKAKKMFAKSEQAGYINK